MPKGPNGEKRPADAIGCAVQVAKIATGEEGDTTYVSKNRRKSGVAGAKARNEKLGAAERSSIARDAANIRWSGKMPNDQSMIGRIYEGEVKVLNLKLFSGTDRDTSAEKILTQVDRVISEIENDALEVIDLDD